MAGTEVRPVRAGTPYGPDVERYMDDLYARTGSDTDKVQKGVDDAAAAQDAADAAQATADDAMGSATLSLEQVQALSEQNAAEVKKANFLAYWLGGL